MLLSKLKIELSQKQSMNILELSRILHTAPDVVRAMLQHWIDKGKVKKCQTTMDCATKCQKCNPLLTEVYQWVEGL